MLKVIAALAFVAIAGPAFAEADASASRGTFSGQVTRGSQVGYFVQNGNVGQQASSFAPGTWDNAVQTELSFDNVRGYGRKGADGQIPGKNPPF